MQAFCGYSLTRGLPSEKDKWKVMENFGAINPKLYDSVERLLIPVLPHLPLASQRSAAIMLLAEIKDSETAENLLPQVLKVAQACKEVMDRYYLSLLVNKMWPPGNVKRLVEDLQSSSADEWRSMYEAIKLQEEHDRFHSMFNATK